jgi:uroporphyrinogen-III synthase
LSKRKIIFFNPAVSDEVSNGSVNEDNKKDVLYNLDPNLQVYSAITSYLRIIQHKIKKALFWCSNLRRPILPEILKQNNIEVEDLIVYETIIQTETINQRYDAIAFLSSAATDSFFNNNQVLPNVPLFAIGETTFNTLKNYSAQNIFVADKPNTTLLLQQVKKYFSL